MRRKTFRQLRAKTEVQFHHHVYVVLLDPAAAQDRKVRALNPQRDPKKPCLYVGMTGLRPELFAHLNPMPFEAAAQMEKELAEDLRAAGYTVTGGT